MLILLSPSKTMDMHTPVGSLQVTHPVYIDQAAELVDHLCRLSPDQLAKLMKVSPTIAEQSVAHYRQWQCPFTEENAKPALLAYKGTVYQAMDLMTFTMEDFAHAQAHVRILSGLYGILRPLDLIQPYRLEMGLRLKNAHIGSLYTFWQHKVTTELNHTMDGLRTGTVIDLSSAEYFKAVDRQHLNGDIIQPVFKQQHRDTVKVVGTYAKQARGRMVDFTIRRRITAPGQLKAFDVDGYRYDPGRSTDRQWVFVRPWPGR